MGLSVNLSGKYIPSFDWAAGIYQGRIYAYALVNLSVGYRFTQNVERRGERDQPARQGALRDLRRVTDRPVGRRERDADVLIDGPGSRLPGASPFLRSSRRRGFLRGLFRTVWLLPGFCLACDFADDFTGASEVFPPFDFFDSFPPLTSAGASAVCSSNVICALSAAFSAASSSSDLTIATAAV